MATIRKRNNRWQVQVRRKSAPSVTRSFALRSDALTWARQIELQVDRRDLVTAHKSLDQLLGADIVSRYCDVVLPRKRSGDCERYLINAFPRHPIAQIVVGDLTTGIVSAYCTERLGTVKPASVRREPWTGYKLDRATREAILYVEVGPLWKLAT